MQLPLFASAPAVLKDDARGRISCEHGVPKVPDETDPYRQALSAG